MKPFNLKEAKAGKPVCTRDGQYVRILCFDANSPYPIVGLVSPKKGQVEIPENWDENGNWSDYKHDLDLMMASIKHEGWINMIDDYEDGRCFDSDIFNSKEKAKNCHYNYADYIATIHIEWEE